MTSGLNQEAHHTDGEPAQEVGEDDEGQVAGNRHVLIVSPPRLAIVQFRFQRIHPHGSIDTHLTDCYKKEEN